MVPRLGCGLSDPGQCRARGVDFWNGYATHCQIWRHLKSVSCARDTMYEIYDHEDMGVTAGTWCRIVLKPKMQCLKSVKSVKFLKQKVHSLKQNVKFLTTAMTATTAAAPAAAPAMTKPMKAKKAAASAAAPATKKPKVSTVSEVA